MMSDISRELNATRAVNEAQPRSLTRGSLRAPFFSEAFRHMLHPTVTFLVSLPCAVRAW